MAETDNMQALVSRRANRRQAQQVAQANQPEELSMADVGTFVAEATPIIGDAIAAKEVYDELQKEEPNYTLIGALGGAALIGMIPLLGDAAASAIRRGARGLTRRADEVVDAATDYSQNAMNADDIIFRWEKGELSNAELRSQMREAGFPIETKRITRNRSGGELEVSTPDGQIVQWDDLPRGYAEGGQVKPDKQMEFLFEEGGMADDGLDRDPVSGNEVPSGSMSEEVRDDIPAQLSEGEYVVPADVVRYFGVKYFEDLRDDAKMGLTQMEQEGRIGGEPVDVEGDDTELTSEELAELDAIMGMAEGGAVTTTYDRLPPQAVGNTGQEQQLANIEQQMTRAFQEGGAVASLDPSVMQQQYGAGFSFMGSDVTQAMPSIEPTRVVTLYGPNGEVSEPLTLPAMQSQYDLLISQGYSTTPPVVAPVVQAPQVQQQQDSGDDNEMSPQEYQRELNRYQTGSQNFSVQDFEELRANPLAFGNRALDKSTTGSSIAGLIAGLAGGPLIGGAVATYGALTPIAESRAALRIAESQNRQGTPEYAALQERINARIEDLPLAARAAMGMGNIATGSRYATAAQEYFDKMDAIDAWDAQRPDYLGNAPAGRETLTAVQNAAANLTGPAAESYAESARSGYTGSGARNIAVGKISGVNGIEGVVADPVTGEVIRDTDKRTVYRDEEGRTYVKTGLLGRGREYRDIEGVPSNPDAPPVDSGGDDSDGGGDSGGSVICTALHNKGLLDSAIYRLDGQYGAMLELSQPEVLYGYRELATPLAIYIQKDTLGAIVTRTLVAPVAKAWANEMAHQMQPENYKGNLLGKAIIKLGYPVCAFVGKRSKEIVYGT